MRFKVLGGAGGGIVKDLRVFLKLRNAANAQAVAALFPSSKLEEDRTLVFEPGPGTSPGIITKTVESVEVESMTLTAILVVVILLVLGLIFYAFKGKG